MNLHILPIAAEETIALRLAILRRGLPRESAIFAEDSHAVHFGAFLNGTIVGIASLHQENLPGEETVAWRLRGMATAENAQKTGIGSAVLSACENYVTARGASLLWCNARKDAAAFYARNGFTIAGEEFEIPTAGPHFVMRKALT